MNRENLALIFFIAIFFVGFLVTSELTMTGKVFATTSTFDDGSESKLLNFEEPGNKTIYIKLPKRSEVDLATIKITSIPE